MKKKGKFIVFNLIIVIALMTINNNGIRLINNGLLEKNNKIKLRNSGYWDLTGSPINIDDSDPTMNWSSTALDYNWCSGSGTWSDPYIIENVTIEGPSSPHCINIINSNVSFIIRNCSLSNANILNRAGINLWETSNGFILNNSISNCGFGIRQESNSNNNTLIGNLIKNILGTGIRVRDSNNINIMENTFEENWGNGIVLEYCNNSLISGNILINHSMSCIYNEWGYNNIISENTLYNGGRSKWGNYYTGGISDRGYNTIILKNTLKNTRIYSRGYNSSILENTILQNTIYSDLLSSGLSIVGVNGTYSKNSMYGCGIAFQDRPMEIMASNSIDTLNLVNGKPIYYYTDKVGLKPSDFINAGQIFLINCNDSLVNNLNIFNTTIGIALYFCNNNSLMTNTITKTDYGIYVRWCNNHTFSGNTLDYNDVGLRYLGLCKENKISENNLRHNEEGVYGINANYDDGLISRNTILNNSGNGILLGGNNVLISNNTINNNSNGLYLSGGSNNTVINNTIYYNSHTGIYLTGINHNISENFICHNGIYGIQTLGHNCTISRNNISHNKEYGINIDAFYENNTISGNILNSNEGYGIYLRVFHTREGYNQISGNEMNNCGFGIETAGLAPMLTENIIDASNMVNGRPLYYYYNQENLIEDDFLGAGQIILINCSNSFINDVNVSFGSLGVSLYYCINTTILKTSANNNNINGIYLYWSNFNNLSENIINYNGDYGIYGDECSDSSFLDNDIQYNGQGIRIHNSNDNIFVANEISDNVDYGVFVHSSSDNNLFYENIFDNSAGINANDDGTNISWDNGTIGNFWHDYDGFDIDGDDIGETPYISGNVIDHFPICFLFDTIKPLITILSPSTNDTFEIDSPEFSITIEEYLLDSTWYTLDRGITNKTFSNLIVKINQTIWDSLPQGTHKLEIYAKDVAGNIGYSGVNIIKYISESDGLPEPNIPGYNTFVLLGILSVVIVIITVKRRNFKF